jgi:hypothetical protein
MEPAMTLRDRLLQCAVACVAAFALPAPAHEFKMDAVMTAFVKIDGGEAHLVLRAPLFLFKSARLPVKNIEIDVPAAAAALERALVAVQQNVVLAEDGRRLTAQRASARLSLPSDRSFATYEAAVAHVATPAEPDLRLYIDQGYVDVHVVYPIRSPDAVFSVRSTAAPELGDYLKLALRYLPQDGSERALLVTSLDGPVALNPTWYGAAKGFVALGIAHILTGVDHLLFLLCLLIPLRDWRQVLAIVTTFTVAHSLTLVGSAFGLAPGGAWFPPFVEMMIAASIVYMALENIMGVDMRRRLLVTGLFGLVHGFGFSYGLQENLQFAGTHLVTSLFAFNAGIEVGQLAALTLMLPALVIVRRYVLQGRVGMIVLSALVALTGWQWMLERGAAFLKMPWPRPTVAGLATLALWIAAVLLATGLIAAVVRSRRRVLHAEAQSLAAD